MKKLVSIILAAAVVLLSAVLVSAEDTAYTLTVNGTDIDLSDLPRAIHENDGHIMIPLRKTAEALGYRVEWDAETGNITVDDDYIQGAVLHSGTTKVVFTGHLKVIDMSREVENAVETVIYEGYTYVPADFFEEFFNDVTVDGMSISVETSTVELDVELKIPYDPMVGSCGFYYVC